ncbi:MAG: bifunctional oligoribonuclease/PAP phosphatase NrnA [Clostridium sp.]|nr:bifunctional oligoribonuclease/PAP phosphatase NrnA [Clostridium sp.]
MNQYLQAIAEAQTIVILGHVRPDGDCVGSCTGMYNYIIDNYPGKQVDIYLGAFDDKFLFLRGADTICHEVCPNRSYDLCLALDCASTDRFGEFSVYYETAKKKVAIDHHASNPGYGDICLVRPEASAACEAIYGILERDKISKYCAESLYLGIVHDTGVFKHRNTTKETMCVAGDLIALGANPQKTIDDTFYSKTHMQNQILGQALLNSHMELDGQCIVTCLRKEVFDHYHASSVDVDGVVDQIRITRGIEVAVFYYEYEPDVYKFSLRSNEKVDVSKIALTHEGGGHTRAAGFSLAGEQSQVEAEVLEQIRQALNEA